MKYTMVKQFSNGAVDNIFSFLFKWVDFGKMFLEFIWSFLEIWIAFFLIFYNLYMYIYYLFLFLIDRGSETSAGYLRLRGSYSKASYLPKIELSSGPTAVPPLYGVTANAGRAADPVRVKSMGRAGDMLTSVRSAAPQGIKKSIFIRFFNSLMNFFKPSAKIISLPFKKLILLFDRGMEQRKKRVTEPDDAKSLIDEYIKEYEYKKK
jgi:hypothetical protein